MKYTSTHWQSDHPPVVQPVFAAKNVHKTEIRIKGTGLCAEKKIAIHINDSTEREDLYGMLF